MKKILRSPVSEKGIPAPRGSTEVECRFCGSRGQVIWFEAFSVSNMANQVIIVDDYRCLNCGGFIERRTCDVSTGPLPHTPAEDISSAPGIGVLPR